MLFLFTPFWFKQVTLKKEPYHYLRFEKDTRYYELRITQDLLEDWILTTNNGRIKSKLGQTRTHAFQTFHEALTQFYCAVKLRHQRHYSLRRYLVDDLIYTFLLAYLISHPILNRKDGIERKTSLSDSSNKKQVNHKVINSHQTYFVF